MAGEVDGNQLRTALVVLAAPAGGSTGSAGFTVAGGRPARPEGAERVRNWFAGKGFAVDPVVGISFSISGPGRLFSRTLGIADAGSSREYTQADLAGRLDHDLIRYVAAVVIGSAPDFGPGNP